jgi:membrane protein YdbS with pleckstrin-like domain
VKELEHKAAKVMKIISGVMVTVGVLAIFVLTCIGLNSMAWNEWIEYSGYLVLMVQDFYSYFLPQFMVNWLNRFGNWLSAKITAFGAWAGAKIPFMAAIFNAKTIEILG